MKIGLVQFSPIWEDKNNSIHKINELIKTVSLTEIDLLIFPELTLTGFTMNSKSLAEDIDGVSTDFFINLARKYKVNVIGGLMEKYERSIFNTLLHIDEFGLIKSKYRKIHPFSLAEEDKYFHSENGIVVSTINRHSMGFSICYDLRFPELYRLYGKQKVEILINIANWPIKRIEHWRVLLKANAIANQAFMIGVNRVGKDPFQTYNGFSSIYSPSGELIFENENDEGIFVSEIDLSEVEIIRKALPFLNDIKLI